MNYTTIAYAVFIVCSIFITVYVGKNLHKNGQVFLRSLFQDEIKIILTINDVLLACYYLLNIGFALYTVQKWDYITGIDTLISSVSIHLAVLLIILASIHVMNLLAFGITAQIRNKNV